MQEWAALLLKNMNSVFIMQRFLVINILKHTQCCDVSQQLYSLSAATMHRRPEELIAMKEPERKTRKSNIRTSFL